MRNMLKSGVSSLLPIFQFEHKQFYTIFSIEVILLFCILPSFSTSKSLCSQIKIFKTLFDPKIKQNKKYIYMIHTPYLLHSLVSPVFANSGEVLVLSEKLPLWSLCPGQEVESEREIVLLLVCITKPKILTIFTWYTKRHKKPTADIRQIKKLNENCSQAKISL